MTLKQLAFVNEYLLTGNATDAYRKIYQVENKEVARAAASRLLTKANISAYIRKHQQTMEKKTAITVEKVISELAKIGFANIQDYISRDNSVEDLSTIKRSKAAAVSQIKTRRRIYRKDGEETETVETEFRLHDKISALEKIGKHLGAFFSIKELVANLDEAQSEALLTELQKRLMQPANTDAASNDSTTTDSHNDSQDTKTKDDE